MSFYTRAELVAELAEVRAAITNALKSHSYTTAGGHNHQNPALKSLRDHRAYLLKQIEQIDATNTGGIFNRVEFKEPL